MNYVKINVKGGILPITELDKILEFASHLNAEHLSLGERQNIFIYTKAKKNAYINFTNEVALPSEWNKDTQPNIMSSYATQDLYSSHPWMSEGVYRDILDSLPASPHIKINIADPTQGLIPLFSGHLNIIPSDQQNYFYMYINVDQQLKPLPMLTYTNEIHKVVNMAESLFKEKIFSFDKLENFVKSNYLIYIPLTSPLSVPRLRFPYFEGMNAYNNGFWLGIYRRDNLFSLYVLYSIRELCAKTAINDIHITPWRTLIIKGIQEKNRIDWEKLLGKHELNTRHSALELNWYLPDHDQRASAIKNQLYHFFDKHDVRTYGLYFSIQTPSKRLTPFASIVIKQRPNFLPFNSLTKAFYFFDILYTKNFDPNSTDYTVHAYNVAWPQLTERISELCSKYYKYLTSYNGVEIVNTQQTTNEQEKETVTLFECVDCLSLYQPSEATDTCTICGAPATSFKNKLVQKKLVQL